MAIIRFSSEGPPATRLSKWEDIPASDIESGSPVQRGRYLVDDRQNGFVAGEWDCTAFTSTLAPYSVHEFMLVLDGSVDIVDAEGRATHIAKGESFVLRKGFNCKWRQTESMRKFFMIWDDAGGAMASDPQKAGVAKIDTAAPLAESPGPSPDLLLTAAPKQRSADLFSDESGQWSVGIWESTSYERKAIAFPRHELMHILEGAVTLTESGGASHTFKAGDTFLIERGTRCTWKNTVPVRKIFCILQTHEQAAQTAAAE